MAAKKQQQKQAKQNNDLPEWETMKSGAIRHAESGWYAAQYINGWYFYPAKFDCNLGPYKSFEEGLKEWKKRK